MSDTGKFKNVMKKLLKQLRTWAKEDCNKQQLKALDTYETKIDMGMSVDCRGSIGLFVDSVVPYAEHILEGNDSYFMDTDIEVESEYMKLQSQLREWWPAFDEDRKDYIRKQIKLLVMLGTIAVKHEELRQVINLYRDPGNPLVF